MRRRPGSWRPARAPARASPSGSGPGTPPAPCPPCRDRRGRPHARVGLGLDLACLCDMRVAADSAKFASSFIKMGIIPGDGGAWVLPRTAGGMSSINFASAAIDGIGLAVGGITTTGTSSITLTCADMFGELIASGNGTATFSLTSNNPLLTASINGAGTATASVSTNTPTLGALADGGGAVTISLSGTLTPYAIGQMSGTTAEYGLTNAGIANSVWSKVVESGFSAEQILRIIAAQAAGSATGLENGNPQFTGLDGVTVRIDGAYSAGTRTIDSLNGD